MRTATEGDNRPTPLDEHFDHIEARIERLEMLYGIDHRNIGPHHTMVIYWSEEDQCYLVSIPDFKEHVMNWNSVCHGDTYEEAAREGTIAIELALMDDTTEQTGE